MIRKILKKINNEECNLNELKTLIKIKLKTYNIEDYKIYFNEDNSLDMVCYRDINNSIYI